MSTDFCALCRELTDYLSLLDEPPHELVVRARAALAEPAPPAEGEVGELVALLRYEAREADLDLMTAEQCHRAADLLAQRYPEPVPVAERLPGPGDLNDKGEYWEWDPTSDAWVLLRPIGLTFRPGPWLPAHALPLPAGEVGHG